MMTNLQVAFAAAVLVLVLVSAYPNGSGPTEQEGGIQEDDPQITLPDNFEVGKSASNGNGSFDSFRQRLEQQREIMVTVEQLRQRRVQQVGAADMGAEARHLLNVLLVL
uniref:Secreted protein n=1 Tax=Plectus sambesii TaxID=2011161 RepID=A0A914WMT7_9BILA